MFHTSERKVCKPNTLDIPFRIRTPTSILEKRRRNLPTCFPIEYSGRYESFSTPLNTDVFAFCTAHGDSVFDKILYYAVTTIYKSYFPCLFF